MLGEARSDKPVFQASLCFFLVVGLGVNHLNFLSLNFLIIKWSEEQKMESI